MGEPYHFLWLLQNMPFNLCLFLVFALFHTYLEVIRAKVQSPLDEKFLRYGNELMPQEFRCNFAKKWYSRIKQICEKDERKMLLSK